jgi:hypothetical protein
MWVEIRGPRIQQNTAPLIWMNIKGGGTSLYLMIFKLINLYKHENTHELYTKIIKRTMPFLVTANLCEMKVM